MIDFDDGDRLLNLFGFLLLIVLVLTVSLLLFTTMNGPNGGEANAPQGNWTLERVNVTHARVTYTSTDPVYTEKLQITVDGRPQPVSWESTFGRVERGVFRAEADQTVRLYWSDGRDDRVLLKEW